MPAVLNEIVLQPIIAAAVFRWESTGFGKNVIERLNRVEFAVRDLPAGTLGTIVGNVVYLDVDAAGHGWFVDPTPSDDKEFVASQEFGLRAVDPRTVEQIDLLSVVFHELGHIAGLDDVAANKRQAMSETLQTGVRRIALGKIVDVVLKKPLRWFSRV